MKIIYALMLLVVAFGTAYGQSTESQQNDQTRKQYTLTITANPNRNNPTEKVQTERVVKTGSDIIIWIRKTNTSNNEINKWNLPGLSYEILDNSGKTVELKKDFHYQGHNEAMLIGTKDMVLQPGESKEIEVHLGDWYQMDQPGMYTIQVSEHVSDYSNSDVVKSNIIKITVLAPDPPAENN